MTIQKIVATTAVVASLICGSVAPASAQPAPVATSSDNNTAEGVMIGLALVGLFMLLKPGGPKAPRAQVSQSGGKTQGSFSLLKF